MIDLPTNILRCIFLKLPEEEICTLHNSVCKKFNTIIEGHDQFKPLIQDLNIKSLSSYRVVNRFAALKGNKEKKYTLNQHCHPILREQGFFNCMKNLFNANLCNEKRIQWVVQQIFQFAEYSLSNTKDSIHSMFLAAERIQHCKHALQQIDWIAYHGGIKNSGVDYKKLASLGEKNWGLKKQISIEGQTADINFSVCLTSTGFYGTMLIDLSAQCFNINYGTEIKNKDKVVFSVRYLKNDHLNASIKKEIELFATLLPTKEFEIKYTN